MRMSLTLLVVLPGIAAALHLGGDNENVQMVDIDIGTENKPEDDFGTTNPLFQGAGLVKNLSQSSFHLQKNGK